LTAELAPISPRRARRDRPLRVLVIAFDSAELCLRLAAALSKLATVRLLLPRAAAAPHLKWLDPAVDFQPFDKPRLREPVRQIRLMRRVARMIREFRPDVIHFQKGHAWFNLVLPLLAREYPVVVSVHDPVHHLGDKSSQRTPQWLMHLGYRSAASLIAHNGVMKREIVETCGIRPERIEVVPLIERGDDSLATDVGEDGAAVLFFGRIWPYKGLAHLIEAEPLITAAIEDARIVIAGEGESLEPYRRLMVHPDRFEIHNEFVSVEERARLFRQACVVVLPYVEATQSGVIPVAYTYSKPVVATAVGGLSSQVEDGRTGYLVLPGDAAALAERIIELLRDEPLRRELGANGRRKLEREWAAPVVAERTLEVYERVLREGRRPVRGPA
jgi:glycosyltransferase involved in cell wall biosynthesis